MDIKEKRIISYSASIRMVAFCHNLCVLALNQKELELLRPKYERFLNIISTQNLIDDEIEIYLPFQTAVNIVTGFSDSKGFIAAGDIAKCYIAMSMAMEYGLFGAWAALDVVYLKADYPHKVDLNDKKVLSTIDSNKLRLTYGLNPDNKRGAALIKIVKDTLKQVG